VTVPAPARASRLTAWPAGLAAVALAAVSPAHARAADHPFAAAPAPVDTPTSLKAKRGLPRARRGRHRRRRQMIPR